jgi:uncharacterized membrane protein/nitrite reductase/ring-hydroxylating ferredoxin subunit
MTGVKHILQGRWLGHPIHPLLVHLPIGLFVLSLILDIASFAHPGHAMLGASFWSMLLGVITALLAALPGFADYASIRRDRLGHKTATTHMILNLIVVVIYIVDLAIRWQMDQDAHVAGAAFVLSLAAIAILSYSGYLGGVMVYDQGIAVGRHRRATDEPGPIIEGPDLGPDDLEEGQTRLARADGVLVTIVKHQEQLYCVQEFCAHRFGPLSEGACHDGKIQCPWHRSEFDLKTGKVVRGPAKVDLKAFDLVSENGRIKLRVNQPADRIMSA